ncbi:MAG: hypothetical protein KDI79_01560 [Anaerolineae bacterium]|nr:hypothetical protein [Anaerolineae bacterium]
MLPSLPVLNKEVDVDFLVFVERYATDLLKWDILTFFGKNPNTRASISKIAQYMGRSTASIRPDLGDLTLLGILEQTPSDNRDEISFQLTQSPRFRRLTIKFAESQGASQPLNEISR